MIKTLRIREGATVLVCLLAGTTFAQVSPLGRTEVIAQTTASTEPLILRLGQIQVKDISGQQLGTLEDIVVSPQGCIDMGVVSLGGTRLVPVPWQMVRTEQATVVPGGAAPMAVTLQVDQTRLAQAPSIDRAQLRTQLSQANFTQQIHTFYGVQANANISAQDRVNTASTNLYGGRIGETNLFGRTNLFPTGRTNLFRGSTNTFPPGRDLGRPEGLPPGPNPGAIPGRPDPGFNNPGTSPRPPGAPGTTPGTSPTFPNPPRSPSGTPAPGSAPGGAPGGTGATP
jgi:hypothetical protein